jgi:hypothetical protein
VYLSKRTAVVHETVFPEIHHIRHEDITREIHNHHVYNRTLPIVDVQVLPARHFVPAAALQALGAKPLRPTSQNNTPSTKDSYFPTSHQQPHDHQYQHQHQHHHHHNHQHVTPVLIADDDKTLEAATAAVSGLTLIEVDPRSLPDRASPGGTLRNPGDIDYSKHPRILETISRIQPPPRGPAHRAIPRQFTARTFKGTEGDARSWVGDDGVSRKEEWWVHPPTLAPAVAAESDVVAGLGALTLEESQEKSGEAAAENVRKQQAQHQHQHHTVNSDGNGTGIDTGSSTPLQMPGAFV